MDWTEWKVASDELITGDLLMADRYVAELIGDVAVRPGLGEAGVFLVLFGAGGAGSGRDCIRLFTSSS